MKDESHSDTTDNTKKLTEELDCDGAPEEVIEEFQNSDIEFSDDIDKIIQEYKEDIEDPDVDAEAEFREAIEKVKSYRELDLDPNLLRLGVGGNTDSRDDIGINPDDFDGDVIVKDPFPTQEFNEEDIGEDREMSDEEKEALESILTLNELLNGKGTTEEELQKEEGSLDHVGSG